MGPLLSLDDMEFLKIDNAIFESLAVCLKDSGPLADFLGIRCAGSACSGTIYPSSRLYDSVLRLARAREILRGVLVFTNHPRDLLDFFERREKSLVAESECYSTKNSFMSLVFLGEATESDNGNLKVSLALSGICSLRPNKYIPLNRFTSALVELLVNLTKLKFYCRTGDNQSFERLKAANAYFLDVIERHGGMSRALSEIAKAAKELSERWSSCP